MWHQPKNLNKEVYNKIGTNFVTSPSNLGIFIAVIGIVALLCYTHNTMRPMEAVSVIQTLSAVIAIVYGISWYLLYYINRKKMRNLDNLIDQYINGELTKEEIYNKLYEFYNK